MTLVCIDAGHGGSDPGALGNGLKEKDITLSIAKKMGVFLEKNNINVMYTRTGDTYPTLAERSQMANNKGANAFISIHCNAFGGGNGSANGIETYCYKFDYRGLADAIHNSLLEDTTLYQKNRGVKEGNFSVLKNTKMSACLVETAFIDNVADSEILVNKQDEFAKQMAKGICDFFKVDFDDDVDSSPIPPSDNISNTTNPVTPIEPTWETIYPKKNGDEYVYSGTGLTAGNYDVLIEISNEFGVDTCDSFILSIPNSALPLRTEEREIPCTLDDYVNTQKGKIAIISKNNQFVNATIEEVKEYANPDRHSLTNTTYKWQHLQLNNYTPVNIEKLNTFLNSKNPGGTKTPVFHNKAQAFSDACVKFNLDVIYFVAHACLETGWGGSALAQGYDVVLDSNGKAKLDSDGFVVLKDNTTPEDAKTQRVYNLFGIGAIDGNVVKGGTTKAYNEGWFTIDKAIEGGAKWISEGYINSTKYPHQNTLYFMRWDYVNGWHQYSTDVGWAEKQSNLMSQMHHCRLNGDEGLVIIYPSYKYFTKPATTQYRTLSIINIRKTASWATENNVIRVAQVGEILNVTNFDFNTGFAEIILDDGTIGYVPKEHIEKV